MRRIRVILALTILISTVSPSMVGATGSTSVVISEVMTGTSASASQEFVELYNPTAADINVASWAIDYKSATSSITESSWTKKATLTGIIPAFGFYLAAPKSFYPNADVDWSSTLASGGGHIRLKDSRSVVIDQLGYGSTANAPEASPAAAPSTGQSIERLPGKTDELAGNGTDTNINSLDFVIRPVPGPQTSKSTVETPAGGPPLPAPIEDPASDNVSEVQPTVQITELLPNPMSPLTDANDEFIELYNPGEQPSILTGYKLRTGSDFHSSYTIQATTLKGHEYLVLKSIQTKLALVNSGGAVQLLNSDGALIDQTAAYGAAAEGQAWAWFDDGWHWTLKQTPGYANELVVPLLSAASLKASAKAKKASTSKKAVKATKKAAKAKHPKAKKLKKAKIKRAAEKLRLGADNVKAATWLIISLSIFTIGYALYEFRNDIQNYYYRLFRNSETGGDTRPPDEGGRSD